MKDIRVIRFSIRVIRYYDLDTSYPKMLKKSIIPYRFVRAKKEGLNFGNPSISD